MHHNSSHRKWSTCSLLSYVTVCLKRVGEKWSWMNQDGRNSWQQAKYWACSAAFLPTPGLKERMWTEMMAVVFSRGDFNFCIHGTPIPSRAFSPQFHNRDSLSIINLCCRTCKNKNKQAHCVQVLGIAIGLNNFINESIPTYNNTFFLSFLSVKQVNLYETYTTFDFFVFFFTKSLHTLVMLMIQLLNNCSMLHLSWLVSTYYVLVCLKKSVTDLRLFESL